MVDFFSRAHPHTIQDSQIYIKELCQNQAQILVITPFTIILFSQIFLYLSLNCGSRNVGNNDE